MDDEPNNRSQSSYLVEGYKATAEKAPKQENKIRIQMKRSITEREKAAMVHHHDTNTTEKK
jgi:hypothetical protein